MPESPDFEKLAEQLVDRIWRAAAATPGIAAPEVVVDALRLVWNARGAADVQAIDAVGDHDGRPVTAIRNLDR